ncbi:jerky protein-like [Anoplophora glabripennis]|uniref:jerky protein-like n=1 Tax=Anoplophora glabripennis TaxID=217634 RepID=UPI0008750510|nr:jerky protein-like [Anoplophora glabripennis]
MDPENMFNVDDSGYTTVHKPGKVIAKKGKKYVGSLTSAEKGKTITVVCCVSAVGQYIPPMFVSPRVRMRPDLLDKGPAEAIGVANPSVWINEELFGVWFDHFLKLVRPASRPEPVLINLDGHTSHTKNLTLIEKARENNVVLLSLPSHCTHRLQPLDVAVFKSINTFYDQAVATWLAQHPGKIVTEKEIPELFMIGYGKGGTIKNAVSGFKKCGIFPFDLEVFTEE